MKAWPWWLVVILAWLAGLAAPGIWGSRSRPDPKGHSDWPWEIITMIVLWVLTLIFLNHKLEVSQ